jgi:hypothetical protein
MKALFVVAASLTLLLGLAWTFLPGPMLSSWGVHGDDVAVYMARRYGALFFGYAIILWLARASEPSAARTAILAGGMVVTSAMAVVSLTGVLTGVVGPAVWSVVVVETLLAGGFAYFYASARA